MAITAFITWVTGTAKSFPCAGLCSLIGTSLILYLTANEIARSRSRIKGLPGPRGLPLIGVLWDIRTNAAERYREWARRYGNVYQVQLGNVTVVVVNSAESARSLFGHNAQALSSRPEFYTFHRVLSDTAGTTIGTSPYSDSLKRRRKAAASALNRPSVANYVGFLDLETRDFVAELLDYGGRGTRAIDPMPMIQRLSLSLSVTLNWGQRIATQYNDLFAEITHVEDEISKFRSTTGNLQDYIPLLRLNPFSSHSARARKMRHRRDVYLGNLNSGLRERMAAGTQQPCIQANVIIDDGDLKKPNVTQRLSAAEMTSISLTMLSGGLDTITTNVAWFIALLTQRPDIQEKAHLEIRKHLINQMHPGRSDPLGLCDAEDDQGCQYVAALVRESLRYYTVLRLALPRVSVRDVVHEGVVLPRGTVFFLNAWACNMDAKVWSDPEVFRPERWLEQPEAPLFTYGVGYRMCAGSMLANRELYLLYMRLIANFRVEPAPTKGSSSFGAVDCHPVSGNCDPTSLVAIPRAYKAIFVPRDPGLVASHI